MRTSISLIVFIVVTGLLLKFGNPIDEFLSESFTVNNGIMLLFMYWCISVYLLIKKVEKLESEIIKCKGDISTNRRGINEVSRRIR